MTSGPMRAGALPPNGQSDPQIIARVVLAADMHIEWDPHVAFMLRNGTAGMESQRNDDGTRTVTIRARNPLTAADIPAGQGAASLFVAPDGRDRLAAWFKRGDGHAMHLLSDPGPGATAAEAAMWDHLAATLRTVTD